MGLLRGSFRVQKMDLVSLTAILLVRVLFLNINYFQLIIVFVYNIYLYFFMTCTKFFRSVKFSSSNKLSEFFFNTFCLIFLWNMPFSLLWNRTEHFNFWLLFFFRKNTSLCCVI